MGISDACDDLDRRHPKVTSHQLSQKTLSCWSAIEMGHYNIENAENNLNLL